MQRRVLTWLPGYRRIWLRADILAGVTLAAVLIPQGMAYAELAGMPAVTGLYATLFGIVGYALFGSSRQLVVGPESSTSTLVFAAIAPLAVAGGPSSAQLGAALGICVGLLCLLGGVFRLGFLADFLGRPVLVGYMNGLAITIVVAQLPKMLGLSVDGDGFVGELVALVRALGAVRLMPAILGVATLATILLLGRFAPRVPGVLVAIVAAAGATAAFDLARFGVATLGAVPSGLPVPSVPAVGWHAYASLLVPAVGIALVSFADTVVESRTFASRNGYKVDGDQDLVGLGAASALSGLFGGMPISSSGSRTAVLDAAGGRTQIANLAAAATIGIVLVAASGVLASLPQPALGAIVLAAALRLFDVASMRRFWRWRRADFGVALLTTIAVLVVGILEGIAVAVVVALVIVVRRATRPYDGLLGRLPDTRGWHNLERHPEAEQIPGLAIFRFEAPLFFANAEHFAEETRRIVSLDDGQAGAGDHRPLRWFVFDAESTSDVDASAGEVLLELIDEVEAAGVRFVLAEATGHVTSVLARYGVLARLGPEAVFASIGAVVDAYEAAGPSPTRDPDLDGNAG